MANLSSVPDIVRGRVLQAGSQAPVRGAVIDVEICTKTPMAGLPGPEGTPHRIIWTKRQATSREDGSFEADLRPWKEQAATYSKGVQPLAVYTVGIKAAGYEDQRVAYTGKPLAIYLVRGTRVEAESTRLCH